MKFLTTDKCPIDVYILKHMPHKGIRIVLVASGTSDHNLSPNTVLILNKCHQLIKGIHCKRDQREIVIKVHREKMRIKYPFIQPGVVTLWRYYHQEATTLNYVQRNLHEALKLLIAEGGCDHGSLKEKGVIDGNDVIAKHALDNNDWEVLFQYEGALDCI